MTYDAPAAPAPTAQSDASVGKRVGGLLLDTLIVLLPLFILSAVLFGESDAGGGGVSVQLTGLPFLIFLVVMLGYFFVTELTTGQTLGKKIVGTRVVSDKASDLGAGQVLVRTLLRIVDGFFFYLVGFVVALISDKNQRVGDMAASTRVVSTR